MIYYLYVNKIKCIANKVGKWKGGEETQIDGQENTCPRLPKQAVKK